MFSQNTHNPIVFNRHRWALLLFAGLILCASNPVWAQTNTNFSFQTTGHRGSGDARSSSGALTGQLRFNFDGSVRSGRLNLTNTMVWKEGQARGQFYRVVFNYRGAVNLQGTPSVQVSETTLYKIIVLDKVPAVADFTAPNTSDNWVGVARVELRFSKVSGVADSFRVDFSRVRKEGRPPRTIQGKICEASVLSGSNMTFSN